MGGYSNDANSWVDRVEVTVPAGTFTATDTSPWAYTWELPDEGIVTVSAVAYDSVGNASTPASVQVIVDSLAPVITSNLPDGVTISSGQSYSPTINISGTVTDNYSGIVRVQMAFNNQPWRNIWQSATPQLNTTWSGTWELPAITQSAQGKHRLRLRAWDAYGNIGYANQTVFVDIVPPTSELTDRRFTGDTPAHVPHNQALNLQGVANDAGNNPVAAGAIPLAGTLDSLDDATIWLQPDDYADDDAGVTVSWIGDFNGDRLGDLAVGFPNGADGHGNVIVVTGQAGDWAIPNLGEMETLFDHTPSFMGEVGAGLGATIAPAGDFNGDGFEELLIGDLANDRIFMIYGTPVTFGRLQQLDDDQSSRWTQISADNQTLTTQFTGVGDVNNDTLSDILVATDSIVYLLVGKQSARAAQPLDSLAAATLAATNASVAGVGDMTGDFVDDFVIATGGTVYLFAGGSGWVEGGLSTLATGSAVASFATSDASPTLVGAGDINGDGLSDFAFSNGSNPTVVYGGSYTTEVLGGFPAALNGFLAAVGDTNKDGNGDLLIGNADGNAYLLLGGNLSTVAATIEDVTSAATAPYTAGADLAGDGSADLALVPSDTSGFGRQLDKARPVFVKPSALPDYSATVSRDNGRGLTMTGDVTVGAGDADFTSIQAAIDSGASRVLIEPGVYYENITLASNVVVAGSGAGLTVIASPTGVSPIVSADNISNATLANLTLRGDGTILGIATSNGATGIALARLLIEGMGTAVSIDGATTDVDLKNNSFIANVNGISATNCADLDVRNSIFAYNTGTALAYEACATIKRHEFNLYYANGTDMTSNDPGSGEIFSNPLFRNYGIGDYRVQQNSPIIDAGAPGDAVPPGAGDFIDIGHIEQTGGGYIASHDYCATCDNDGLIWGVNAFDTIQGAVDSAESDLLDLFDGDGSQFTVGVDMGTFTESVTINWNLQLLGSDPDNTTIQGVGAPAVTISGTVGTKVAGFTLIGGGASPIGVHVTGGSNSIELTRNLIKDNNIGVLFDGRSSGDATFNTLINNTTALQTTGKYNWIDANSNLISGNSNGLVANNSAAIFTDFNLLFNSVDYTNVITGVSDIVGSAPMLTGEFGYLTVGSPAIDAGEPTVAVPTGGGRYADIGWHELTIAPIAVMMGQADTSIATESFGVGSVEYAIVSVADPATPVSATLPISWTQATLTEAGAQVTYWNATFTPTSTGYYRIYSRSADGLGNRELDSDEWFDGAFYVDDTAPVVSISADHATGVASTWIQLTGIVTDYVGTSFDVDEVYFTIDGTRYEARWSLDGWEADGVSGRSFHYLFMNETGATIVEPHLQAFAVDGAGQIGSSAVISDVWAFHDPNTLYFDSTAPRIWHLETDDDYPSVIPPFNNNNIYSGTITFQGLAYDQREHIGTDPQEGFSGIDGYQISFDGGLTWDTMERTIDSLNNNEENGRILPYDWPVPEGLDATTIPVKIRATDYDGNSRVFIVTITVDTGAPRVVGTLNLDAGPALGTHLDETTDVTFSWVVPTDGSSEVTMLGEFGQTDPDIPPTAVQPTNSAARTISEAGAYYAVVGAEDEVGNVAWISVGPWYAGQLHDFMLPWQGTLQSIYATTDGLVDIDHDEYVLATEWLDDDTRPVNTQSLYATWDADNSFTAWQGADWATDGTMWLYYDLWDSAGTTMPVSGTVTLPFEAEYAVSYDGNNISSWEFESGAWTTSDAISAWMYNAEAQGLEFTFEKQVASPGGTALTDNHRMMAFAVDDAGDVWSAFPTSNSLDGNFETYFDWNITQGHDLLLLPEGAQLPALVMNVSSDPTQAATLTSSDTVTMAIAIRNEYSTAAQNAQLRLTSSAGVNYQSVSGATCNDCASADNWLLDLPALPIDATQTVTVVAQLDADLTGLTSITNTIALISSDTTQQSGVVVHDLDLTVPTVEIVVNPGNAIGTGLRAVTGNANDGEGAGVALVEVSLGGSSWSTADGTDTWTADINVTGRSNTQSLFARVTDFHGQVSSAEMVTLTIDSTAPVLTATTPALVGNVGAVALTGTTSDPAPADAQVAQIDAQFDSETTWREGSVEAPIGSAAQAWSYSWQLPSEDGIEHTVRYRATDYAGNVTISDWYTTVVDTVAPVVTVTDHQSYVISGTMTAALSGTVSDGYGVAEVRVLIYPAVGAGTEMLLTVTTGNWSVTLDEPFGTYTLIVIAEDVVGNQQFSDPYQVLVTDSVPTAVIVSSSSFSLQSGWHSLYLFAIALAVGSFWLTRRRKRV